MPVSIVNGGTNFSMDAVEGGRARLVNREVFSRNAMRLIGAAAVDGDLAVVVVGSSSAPASFSAGWNQIFSTGSEGSFVSGYFMRRFNTAVYESGNRNSLTLSFYGVSSCVSGFVHLRSPYGFDESCIKSYTMNWAVQAGATYAVVGAFGAVASGDMAIAIGGGHSTEAYMANTSGMTGTNWTQQSDGGMSWAAGVGCVGTAWNNTVGTPTLPSATFNLAAQSMRKFIAALVVREAPPPPPAGGGLFWGQ